MNTLKEEISRTKELMGLLYEQGSGSNAPEDTTAESPKSCEVGFIWSEEEGDCVKPTWKQIKHKVMKPLWPIYEDMRENPFDVVQILHEAWPNMSQINDVASKINRQLFGKLLKKPKELEKFIKEKRELIRSEIMAFMKGNKLGYQDAYSINGIKDRVRAQLKDKTSKVIMPILKSNELAQSLALVDDYGRTEILDDINDGINQLLNFLPNVLNDKSTSHLKNMGGEFAGYPGGGFAERPVKGLRGKEVIGWDISPQLGRDGNVGPTVIRPIDFTKEEWFTREKPGLRKTNDQYNGQLIQRLKRVIEDPFNDYYTKTEEVDTDE